MNQLPDPVYRVYASPTRAGYVLLFEIDGLADLDECSMISAQVGEWLALQNGEQVH